MILVGSSLTTVAAVRGRATILAGLKGVLSVRKSKSKNRIFKAVYSKFSRPADLNTIKTRVRYRKFAFFMSPTLTD